MSQKRIAIFGSTGSIGTQALEVIGANPDKFSAEVLTAQTNDELLVEQAIKFNPNVVVIGDEKRYLKVKEALSHTDVKVFAGEKALSVFSTEKLFLMADKKSSSGNPFKSLTTRL